MEFKNFKERLFNRAKELNFEKYELYYGKSEALNITSSNEEVERYGLSTSIGVSFRGIYNGKMGYSYPGDVTLYPQETPVGASCEAQACIGVDNPGNFKINFSMYDGNTKKQSAVFEIEV